MELMDETWKIQGERWVDGNFEEVWASEERNDEDK